MNVFIGYDSREDIAFQVCKYSIVKHQPHAKIFPIKQADLTGIYNRPVDPQSSTEFSFTRFLVPYLSSYNGWALFADCDFLFLDDVSKLFDLVETKYAVMVVKHNYQPLNKFKMDGKIQHVYPRKNWSSLILFNCSHPSNQQLTPTLINSATGQYLHQFSWLDDIEIGELDFNWNWLVGWNKIGNPKALHYTEGGPWFENYKDCEYSDLWLKYYSEIRS